MSVSSPFLFFDAFPSGTIGSIHLRDEQTYSVLLPKGSVSSLWTNLIPNLNSDPFFHFGVLYYAHLTDCLFCLRLTIISLEVRACVLCGR